MNQRNPNKVVFQSVAGGAVTFIAMMWSCWFLTAMVPTLFGPGYFFLSILTCIVVGASVFGYLLTKDR